VLDAAYEEGIKTFMCTTHDRVAQICDHWRADPYRYRDYAFFPCMPYAHKFANAVTDHGVLGAIKRFLPDEGLFEAATRGGMSLLRKDIEGVTTLLIDAEMKMFKGLKTPVIFLQNVVVDLLLGLNFKEAFRIFADHVKLRYGAEPGFITMNMPRLLDTLDELRIENPIVCSSINRIGFRMCGGIDLYVDNMKRRQFRPIAMSVLASGAIRPEQAFEWVCGLPKLEAIVFGASSRSNIQRSKQLVDQYWKCKSHPRTEPQERDSSIRDGERVRVLSASGVQAIA
jgi:hypothetical protein